MGYEEYEQPMIKALIYYKDDKKKFSFDRCSSLFSLLEKYSFSAITKVELGKNVLVDGILKNGIDRFSRKDLTFFDLKNKLYEWASNDKVSYIKFIYYQSQKWICDIIWYKNYRLPNNTFVSDYTFNTFEILSSYEQLNSQESQKRLVGLFCELSDFFNAFYGVIEDISTSVDVLDRTKEKVFTPDYLQAVYWGNYLSSGFCLEIGEDRIKKIPGVLITPTKRGVFFSVTDDLFDSKDNPDFKKRKRILRYLSHKKVNLL